VTVEESQKKFDTTIVGARVVDGKKQIETISLGGTRTKLNFK
jgi:hypothetical protein